MDKGFLRRRKNSETVSPEESADDLQGQQLELKPFSLSFCFVALLVSRTISARTNIIHDCDETFNFWEPLHYITHGYGLQTWEYSSEFGLRSYLYLLIHGSVTFCGKYLFGSADEKVLSFYLLRFVLGGMSAASEAYLTCAVGKIGGRRLGAYMLILLCFASGSFTASTTFLPSTFSMYGLSLSTGLVLDSRPAVAVAVAAASVLIGWPFAVLATVPIVLHALTAGNFFRVFSSGAATTFAVLTASLLVDRLFYGRWTLSVLNLVRYNVLGGGDSALYGTEPPLFYLKNLALNFNVSLPLALLSPPLMLALRRAGHGRLLVAVLPFFLWLGFMSLQAHKEERFLYLVYPHLCLSAAIVLEGFPDLLPRSLQGQPKNPTRFLSVVRWIRPLIIGVNLWLSFARSSALLTYYSAPMEIYGHLPSHAGQEGAQRVCVGSEWHRFPSSFFLPSPHLRVGFLDDGFRGLLPFPFSSAEGGTVSAPKHFNSRNLASPGQFVESEEQCDFLVELALEGREWNTRGSNSSRWKLVKELPFLDAEKSSPFFRAFLIPGFSEKYVSYGDYRLLERTHRITAA